MRSQWKVNAFRGEPVVCYLWLCFVFAVYSNFKRKLHTLNLTNKHTHTHLLQALWWYSMWCSLYYYPTDAAGRLQFCWYLHPSKRFHSTHLWLMFAESPSHLPSWSPIYWNLQIDSWCDDVDRDPTQCEQNSKSQGKTIYCRFISLSYACDVEDVVK